MSNKFLRNVIKNGKYLFIAALLFASFRSRAQVSLTITQTTNVATAPSGSEIVDTIKYACSGLTGTGVNMVAYLDLPQYMVPYVISPFSASVEYNTNTVSSVTYDAVTNKIMIVFKTPFATGQGGIMEIHLAYQPGVTPNGYNPNLIASISATNVYNQDSVLGGLTYDTTVVVATAANNYKVTKAKKYGGALDDLTIYQISLNQSSSIGSLDFNSPVVVDTLPAGSVFRTATVLGNSNPPTYNSTDNTITWTWPAGTTFSNYSGSAYVSVFYNSPLYHLGDNVCNYVRLSGNVPSLPIGTSSNVSTGGSACFGLTQDSAAAACNGGHITAATANWLDHHVLAGTSGNTFSNGWYNSGNTQLDQVDLTYDIDKSVDVSKINVGTIKDAFDSAVSANIYVEYKTNLNSSFTSLPTSPLQSTSIYDGSIPSSYTPPLGANEYLTQVHLKIVGTLPLGSRESLSYSGTIRTAIQGAKDGSVIKEGTYNPVNVIGDDGTVIHNISVGSYTYKGVTTNYTTCKDSAEIIYAQPAFHNTNKYTQNSYTDKYRPSDTVTYVLHTYLGGNDVATNVTFSDTLDSRLDFVVDSSVFYGTGISATQLIPTVTTVSGKKVLTFSLGNLAPLKDYYVRFYGVIHPGTLAGTISNKFTLKNTNALFNTESDSKDVTVIASAAIRAFKGQSGCDRNNILYYPNYAQAQEGGPVDYKISVVNLGNVVANALVLYDVFPFINDYRGSGWYANLVAPVTLTDKTNSTKVWYTTVSNPCYTDFSPSNNPSNCNTPSWSTTPPVDITKVKAIKITRSANINPLTDTIVLSWPMRAPVGVPTGLFMNNSIMYQANAVGIGQFLPSVPNMVGMYTNCTPTLGSIGNYAWLDTNKNGLQDEPANLGLNGVKVYLYDAGPDKKIGGGDDILIDSTATANDWNGNPGYYKFVQVPTGNYFVKFPTNYSYYKITPTTDKTNQIDGNSDADTLSGLTGIIPIDANGTGQDRNNTTIDAGFYPIGSIGNYVWFDANGNGVQDDGNTGINGLKVILYKQDNTGTYVKIDSTFTSNNGSNAGYYNFVIDRSGNYKVQFPTTVSTKVITKQTITAQTDNNSDADSTTGFSPVIVMNLLSTGKNKDNPTIDAGYKCIVPTPVVSTLANQLCNGFNTTLTAVGNPTLTWYKDNVLIAGATNTSYTTSNAGTNPTPAGSYTVTSTDTGGCVSAASTPVVITIPAPPTVPTITAAGPTTFCSGKTLVLTSSVGVSYQWYKDGVLIPGATYRNDTVSTSGNYTVVVSNTLGCLSTPSAPATITVNVTPSPSKPTLYSVPQFCMGDVILTSDSSSSYQWRLNGVNIPGANSKTYAPIASGKYSVVLTGSTGCISAPSDSIYAFVYVTPTSTVSVTSGTTNLCGGSYVQLSSYSGYSSYQWYVNDTLIVGANGLTYFTNHPGSYTIVTTDGTGCKSYHSAPIEVKNVPAPAKPIISGSNTICGNGSTLLKSSSKTGNQWYYNGYPIYGATDTVYLANYLGVYSVVTTSGNCYSASDNDTITSPVKADFNYATSTVANVPCLENNQFQFINKSTGATSYLWSFDNGTSSIKQTPDSVTYTTYGYYNVKLVVDNGVGCKDSVTKPVPVFTCSVSPGSGGGLESKRMGDIIAQRVFNNYFNSITTTVDYAKLPNVTSNQIHVFGGNSNLSLSDLLPSQNVLESILGVQMATYRNTPAGLTTPTTNAVEVVANDYTVGQTTKAVALATKTFGEVYTHSKPICDRLKGDKLLNVTSVTINNINLLQFTLEKENGSVEYAISFSAGSKSGSNNYLIQCNWLNKDYSSVDTMYNFQLWATRPDLVNNMAQDVLNKFQSIRQLQQITQPSLPLSYISSFTRDGCKMNVSINNTSSASNGVLEFIDYHNELSVIPVTRSIPVALSTGGSLSTTTISMNDYYESDVRLLVNGAVLDQVYTNDGPWSLSYNKTTTTIQKYAINNDTLKQTNDELRLFRNVEVQANTSDYVSVLKLLRAAGESRDVTSFNRLKFSTNTTGVTAMSIVLIKSSITNWNNQFTYTIPVNGNQNFDIPFTSFKSGNSSDVINANDIAGITITFMNNTGATTKITANLNNLRFSKSSDKAAIVAAPSLDKSIMVSPNPSNGTFNCKFNALKASTGILKVFEISTGRIVYTKEVAIVKGVNSLDVTISDVNSTNEFVLVIDGEVKYDKKNIIIRKY